MQEQARVAEASRVELEEALVDVQATLGDAVEVAETSRSLIRSHSSSMMAMEASSVWTPQKGGPEEGEGEGEAMHATGARYMVRIDEYFGLLQAIKPRMLQAKEEALLEERRLSNAKMMGKKNLSREKVAAAHDRAARAARELAKLGQERDGAVANIQRGIKKFGRLLERGGEARAMEEIKWMQSYVESKLELILFELAHDLQVRVAESRSRQITRLESTLAATRAELDEAQEDAVEAEKVFEARVAKVHDRYKSLLAAKS